MVVKIKYVNIDPEDNTTMTRSQRTLPSIFLSKEMEGPQRTTKLPNLVGPKIPSRATGG